MKRRSFLKNAGLFTVGLSLAEKAAFAKAPLKNKLPKWKGFNLLDFFSPNGKVTKSPTTAEHLKWMRDWGFDFIRIPIAYPYYLNFDRTRNITPEETYHVDEKKMDEIDNLVRLSQENGMHVSINLHRAPGYCINAGFNEPFNLWKTRLHWMHFVFIGRYGRNGIKTKALRK
jgi:aryl-phospho-beta-D-glucosidase BglC (GH1 family)